MKALTLMLDRNDKKARDHIVDSLEVSSFEHYLSSLMLDKYLKNCGDTIAVVGEWYDLHALQHYDEYVPVPCGSSIDLRDRPIERVISFVKTFLDLTPDGVVVSENWGWNSSVLKNQAWPPIRVGFYEETVYHLLTCEMTGRDCIERAIIPRHHWQPTICARCKRLPNGECLSKDFFNELIGSFCHLIIPAFDGGGYLIWTLEISKPPG